MAKKSATIDLIVDTRKPAKNLKELTDKIREMRAEIEGRDFGSERFIELQNAISTASGELKILEKNMEGLEPAQKAESFLKMGEGIAGSFAIASGAMAMFGTESANLQKLQTQVQGAIAIAMGVRMISEAALEFGIARRTIAEKASLVWTKLGKISAMASSVANWIWVGSQTGLTAAIGGTSIALKILRAAIIATGIGALVIGVVSLVSAFMDWIGATEEEEVATVELTSATRDHLDALREKADRVREVDKAETENEKTLLRLKHKLQDKERANNKEAEALDDLINSYRECGANTQELEKELRKLIKTQYKAEQATRDEIAALEDLMKKEKEDEAAKEKSRQRAEARQRQRETDQASLVKMLEDLSVLEKKTDEEKEIRKNEIDKLREIRSANEIANTEIREKTLQAIRDKYHQIELDRVKKKNKKIEDEEKDSKAKRKAIEEGIIEEWAQFHLNEQQKEIRAMKQKYAELIKEAELNGVSTHLLLALQKKEEAKIVQNYIDDVNKVLDEKDDRDREREAEWLQLKYDTYFAAMEALVMNMDATMAEIDQQTQRELENENLTEEEKEKIQMAADAKKKKVDEQRKKVQAAMAIVETYKAAVSAYGAMAVIPIVGPVLGAVAAAAAIAAGLANVRMIYAQDVGGGASGGGSTPAARPQPAKAPTTGAFTLGGGDTSKKPIKAYVVTDEMTNSQDQLEGIRQQSSI